MISQHSAFWEEPSRRPWELWGAGLRRIGVVRGYFSLPVIAARGLHYFVVHWTLMSSLLWFTYSPREDAHGTVVLKIWNRASLVAQWLRSRLPMQGTRVRALAWEDPTCHRAAKPVCHNYWAWALEPASHNYWAHVPQLLKPARLEPVLCNKRRHDSEKPVHCNEE